jgi:hypothetical protein
MKALDIHAFSLILHSRISKGYAFLSGMCSLNRSVI